MRWKRGRRSTNIEDRRGMGRGGGVFRTGAPGGTRRAGFGLGGGALIIVLILAWLTGFDLSQFMQPGQQSMPPSQSMPLPEQSSSGATDEASDFVSVVLADTEDTWNKIFSQANARYQAPKLVLFEDAVQSPCGMTSSAAGPFYCPGDRKVYLDLSFLRELQRLGAHGDFAVAYVIAHEVGHHVQTLAGTADQVAQAKAGASQRDANRLQVRMELQADCFAGIWAHHAHRERQILEEGDVEEGLSAAAAVGDDRLMKAAGRRVHPDAFTHGTSEQRMQWFRAGLETGSIDTCNTFAAN